MWLAARSASRSRLRPDVESFVLPDATHLLHIQDPRGMAERLAAFFDKHSPSANDRTEE